jgi:hypothetical protein
MSAAYEDLWRQLPPRYLTSRGDDGQNLALSVAKWEGRAGIPGKPFMIWALGSSWTHAQGHLAPCSGNSSYGILEGRSGFRAVYVRRHPKGRRQAMGRSPVRHAIITACDSRYGDFLVDHWLQSLRAHVDLADKDVVVLDYGLSDGQRASLQRFGVECRPSPRDGNVTNLRYRDMAALLTERAYDQVLAIDGGDVIFQADISPVFERDKDRFRAVCEEIEVPFHDGILPQDDLCPEKFAELQAFLRGKPQINGGVIFGPAASFKTLWDSFQLLWRGYRVFGTDQLMMNYLLYKHGFVPLENKYNFALVTMRSPFRIRRGVFYTKSGEVIPIVHNAGMSALTRTVRKFGFGPDRNKRKYLTPLLLRTLFALIRWRNRWRRQPEPRRGASDGEGGP